MDTQFACRGNFGVIDHQFCHVFLVQTEHITHQTCHGDGPQFVTARNRKVNGGRKVQFHRIHGGIVLIIRQLGCKVVRRGKVVVLRVGCALRLHHGLHLKAGQLNGDVIIGFCILARLARYTGSESDIRFRHTRCGIRFEFSAQVHHIFIAQEGGVSHHQEQVIIHVGIEHDHAHLVAHLHCGKNAVHVRQILGKGQIRITARELCVLLALALAIIGTDQYAVFITTAVFKTMFVGTAAFEHAMRAGARTAHFYSVHDIVFVFIITIIVKHTTRFADLAIHVGALIAKQIAVAVITAAVRHASGIGTAAFELTARTTAIFTVTDPHAVFIVATAVQQASLVGTTAREHAVRTGTTGILTTHVPLVVSVRDTTLCDYAIGIAATAGKHFLIQGRVIILCADSQKVHDGGHDIRLHLQRTKVISGKIDIQIAVRALTQAFVIHIRGRFPFYGEGEQRFGAVHVFRHQFEFDL